MEIPQQNRKTFKQPLNPILQMVTLPKSLPNLDSVEHPLTQKGEAELKPTIQSVRRLDIQGCQLIQRPYRLLHY